MSIPFVSNKKIAEIAASRARPLQTTFNRQLNTARGLYGPQLVIPGWTQTELREQLQPLLPYYAERDRGIIADRVCQTIRTRQKQNESGRTTP